MALRDVGLPYRLAADGWLLEPRTVDGSTPRVAHLRTW
jgi:hypothetical protein